MKITRANYEVYFLDYLDGTLDDNLVDVFIEFLQENPDLKEELQRVGSVSLEPETIIYKRKEKLFRERYDLEEVFEKTAVAFMEGDLTEKEKEAFEAYLSVHPEKKKAFIWFQKTKLQPENQIVFRNKEKLLRSSKGKTILLWVTRVAAVAAIAFLAGRYAGDAIFGSLQPENQVVITENKNENPEPKSLPEKVVKKEDPVTVKEKTQVPVKKAEPKAQPHRSLRESNSGRIDHEKVAFVRPPVEVPEMMPALQVSLLKSEVAIAALAPVNNSKFIVPSTEFEEKFLADVVKEKTGLDNISLNKVAKAGLKLISGFSREKFNYETNSEGQITELNFDSRLLAFSIPTNQN